MKEIKLKLVIFLGLPLLPVLFSDFISLPKTFRGVCERVIDGDTVIVAGQTIRLANIDAPESSQYSYDGIPIGKRSAAYLRQLVLGKELRVRYKKRGHYGRIIGTLYLTEEINLKMIKAGMALAYQAEHIKYQSMEYQARLTRKGIFSSLGFDRPNFYRKKKRKAAKN